uniref:Uncharacterized protein n=1 Tax=Eutreptiella gymnastica TaxID=73025 RepID=A0A6T2HH17_9EUGL
MGEGGTASCQFHRSTLQHHCPPLPPTLVQFCRHLDDSGGFGGERVVGSGGEEQLGLGAWDVCAPPAQSIALWTLCGMRMAWEKKRAVASNLAMHQAGEAPYAPTVRVESVSRTGIRTPTC